MDRIEAMRLFVRLAERRSFSAAARDLRIKQSTASKWVAELESTLGVTLVERTTRSLHITEAGRRFQARAIDVIAAVDGMADDLAAGGTEPAGRVRLNVPVVFGRLFVVPIVSEFLARNPRIDADVVLTDRYVNLVEEGFDLAVRVGIPADTTARGYKLGDGRRSLVASQSYLTRHGRPETPEDLTGHDCILFGEPTGANIWRFGRDGERRRQVSVRGRIVANNSEVILEMVRAGLGVALLADWLVGGELRRKRLVPLLEDYDPPPAPIYALTPPGRYTPAPVRALIHALSEALPARLAAASGHG